MKKALIGIAAMLAYALFSASAVRAADPARVGTFPIPLMVESAQKGVFVELAGEISKRVGQPFEIVVLPPQRTVEDFLGGKLDVMFPALDVLFPADKMPVKTRNSSTSKRTSRSPKKARRY